jgi:ribosomal protein S18 acetylase RimI-like enzyme
MKFPIIMKNILILPATPDERTWAATLLATSEPWITLRVPLEKCISTCHNPEYLLFVAHDEGKPCGMVLLDPLGMASSPYLKSIAVTEEYRNQHIGSALLAFAENYFRNNARHFFLCVSSFNNKARKFYEHNGYQAVGELKDYIIQGESEIIMHKRI